MINMSSPSTLVHKFSKEDNDKTVKCSVYHEALTSKVREAVLLLDIQYPPSVSLERIADTNTEVSVSLPITSSDLVN